MAINNSKWWLALLPILALAVALPLTVKRLSSPQEKIGVAPQAATPTGTASFIISPNSGAVAPGQSFPVNVQVYAPQGQVDDKGITGIKAVLNVTPAANMTITASNIQTPLSSPWSYVRKDVVTTGNTTVITIEALYLQSGIDGYLGAKTAAQTFAVLNFTIAGTSGSPTITVDTSRSEVRRKLDNADILTTNLTPGSYTVYADTTAPNTQITGNPAAVITTNSATFTFSGTDAAPPPPMVNGPLTYAYKLDAQALSAYSSTTSATFTNLSVGSHTFSVQAKDAAGNVDATPAQFTFSYTPQTQVSLQFKLPGKLSAHATQNVQFVVRNGSFNSGLLTTTAAYVSGSGNYVTPSVVIPNFPSSGSYDVLVQIPGFLNKLWNTNTVTSSQANTLTRTSTADLPIWGDVTGDNTIQLSDITAVVSVWTQSDTPVVTATRLYDLDENNFIALSDITAVISNWTASVVTGAQ